MERLGGTLRRPFGSCEGCLMSFALLVLHGPTRRGRRPSGVPLWVEQKATGKGTTRIERHVGFKQCRRWRGRRRRGQYSLDLATALQLFAPRSTGLGRAAVRQVRLCCRTGVQMELICSEFEVGMVDDDEDEEEP